MRLKDVIFATKIVLKFPLTEPFLIVELVNFAMDFLFVYSLQSILSSMEDPTYFSNAEAVVDSSTALKTLVRKHHQFLAEQKKIKVF